MRPALKAALPASTAWRMATAVGRDPPALQIAEGEQNVAAELHRQGSIGGGADAAGVEDDRHFGLFDDDRDVVRIPDSGPEPIGEPSGITAAQPTAASRLARIGSSFV